MNRERLTYLIDILSAVPPERFDIKTWRTDCGTAACALGWACSSPHFQEQGLNLGFCSSVGPDDPLWVEPEYLGLRSYYAGAAFFEITLQESEYLFSPSSYELDEFRDEESGSYDLELVTPAHVIARIQELLAS